MKDMKQCENTVEMDSRRLWEEIFSEDSAGFLDYYDAWKMTDNRRETRYMDGRLVSMVHWNPYRICARGRRWDSYYIVAVATRPEYRHRGLMAGQLWEGMERFHREHVPFLFLMPADPAIYQPFDFRYIYAKSVLEMDLPGEAEGETGALTIRPLREQEWAKAAAFANERLSECFEMFTHRSEAVMERTDRECRSEGGALEGIFYGEQLVGVLDWWGDTDVDIREIILLEEWEASSEAVFDAIRRRWPKAEDVTMVTTGWAGEPQPIIMGRIVNLEEFLKVFSSEWEQEIVLCVKDSILAENDGTFLWTMGPDGSGLGRTGEKEDLEISVADLMSWLSGYAEVMELPSIRTNEKGREFARNVNVLRGIFIPEIV